MQVMIWLDMLNIMPLKEAFMLALLNEMKNHTVERIDGWFQCPVKFLLENTGGQFDHNMQNKLLNRLKERGYVEIKRAKQCAHRYVKVDIHKAIMDTRAAMKVALSPTDQRT